MARRTDEQLAVYSSRDARDKTERSNRPRTAEREGLEDGQDECVVIVVC